MWLFVIEGFGKSSSYVAVGDVRLPFDSAAIYIVSNALCADIISRDFLLTLLLSHNTFCILVNESGFFGSATPHLIYGPANN